MRTINAGFLPLNDAAILIAAREFGFCENEGIDLNLIRETSWANVRDRISVGHFEVAHMLAPMPIAANLGLAAPSPRLIAPVALGLGGNAVTVSTALWDRMRAHGAQKSLDPEKNGAALKACVSENPEQKLRFAVVHPHSSHNFDLRYWLAACGIDPAVDVEIGIVPPPLIPQALAVGRIDGFCVGEPWNSVVVSEAAGTIVTTKSAIWRSSPEKVLGVNAQWAEDHADTLSGLIRSLVSAAAWCGQAENLPSVAKALSRSEYLAVDEAVIMRGLNGTIAGEDTLLTDFFITHDYAATFPWCSHALWFYSQMVRWGHVSHSPENSRIANTSYRPDLYRAAFRDTQISVPGANSKVEGALSDSLQAGATVGHITLGPDGFFDGQIFDPEKLDDYIASQGAG